MPVLQSRHLQWFEYDPLKQTLQIQFVNGDVHQYEGVPESIAHNLKRSNSPGSYFHSSIRGQYKNQLLFSMRKK